MFYWRITWNGSQGLHISPVFAVYVTSGNCCVGLSGNVNGDPGDIVDIGDLTALIQYLFIPPNNPPACDAEANANGDIEGTIDIGDLTALIQYLFIPPNNPPVSCQ